MRIVPVTDDAGVLVEPDWLSKAEPVHRQLRPQLPSDYVGRLQVVFSCGARMALVAEDAAVVAVGVWRVVENTNEGRRLYVDDLVCDEGRRSRGAGKMLLRWLEEKAVSLGCDALSLDSGVQRSRAHQFYFREGMHIPAFCFRKALK